MRCRAVVARLLRSHSEFLAAFVPRRPKHAQVLPRFANWHFCFGIAVVTSSKRSAHAPSDHSYSSAVHLGSGGSLSRRAANVDEGMFQTSTRLRPPNH